MLIYRSAYGHAIKLKGLSDLDKIIIDLEFN